MEDDDAYYLHEIASTIFDGCLLLEFGWIQKCGLKIRCDVLYWKVLQSESRENRVGVCISS